MKLSVALLLISLLGLSLAAYNVEIKRYSDEPILSNTDNHDDSQYTYNYNAAIYVQDEEISLLVRSQSLKDPKTPFAVGPSYVMSSDVVFNGDDSVVATPADENSFVPNNTTEACGTEDPRISECNGTYYLFYTAYDCSKAMLSLATTTNPKDPKSWTRQGYVLPNIGWSKSGAALWADAENGLTQHYLFWGDGSSPADGIGIATSQDGISWDYKGDYLIKTRKDSWDSALVESGPSPMRLSTGDFLFIYNSARGGYPSVKANWDLQYNIGFLILDGKDPTKIKQRSEQPIMSPDLIWEIGNSTEYLTPNVVFLEGMVRSPDACEESAECFFAVYGGSDSATGAVKIIVTHDNDQDAKVIITKE